MMHRNTTTEVTVSCETTPREYYGTPVFAADSKFLNMIHTVFPAIIRKVNIGIIRNYQIINFSI
jgi:hypothetical protein